MPDRTPPDWDLRSAELARAAISDGLPTRWFEELYAEGAAGRIGLPWDRGGPLPPVVENVRDDGAPVSARPPWAFTAADLDLFGVDGLRRTLTQQHPMATTGPGATRSRWLVEFVRPTSAA